MSSARVLSIARPEVRRRALPLAYPDYPIERRVRSNAHDFQLAFAQEAAARIDQPFDDALLAPGYAGLLVLGRHEQALKPPVDVLIALYPWKLEVGMARVRCQEGDVTREPVMRVTVNVPRFNAQAVREDLAGRTDEPVSLTFEYDRAVITTKARLARLLGYEQSLQDFTRGQAEASIRLSEWAQVPPPEGPSAA